MKIHLRMVAMLLILAMAVSMAACGSSSQDQEKPGQTEVKPEVAEPVQQYIEVSREGMVDRIPVEIISGVAADYTIAMDPEYFSFRSDGEYDTFSYDEWEGDVNVYYTIYPYPDTTPQELADGLVHMYGGDYADCMIEQAAVGMYDAKVVYLYDDLRGNGGQMRFYLIGTDYGCLVIEAQFVTEMYEGLYAIMRACFDTLSLTQVSGAEE